MRVCSAKSKINELGGSSPFFDRVNDLAMYVGGESRQVRQKLFRADYVNYIYRDKARYILAKKNVHGFRR